MGADGRNAGPLDLLKVLARGAARRAGNRQHPTVDPAFDPTALGDVRDRMLAQWRSLGVSEATMSQWLADAFSAGEYRDAVERCRRVWGSLEGKRIVDLGCGWGSLSVLFARAGAEMTFLDRFEAHVEVTRMRVPAGTGYVADARDLGSLRKDLAGRHDFILLNSLIEHVGPPPEHRGDAESSLEAKRAVIAEAAHLVKKGGGVYIATGNFEFPIDGEIKTWFFHWLPVEEQRRVLEARGLDADLYGLLRWPQLLSLCEQADLRLETVETVELRFLSLVLTWLSMLSRLAGYRLPRREIAHLQRLIVEDPQYMPTWFAFFRKAA